jgi:hypothetical protein
MRWDALFADLEAQFDALAAAERDAEIADRTRSEVGRLGLIDRLRAAIGTQLRVACRGDLTLTGRLDRVHPEWLLVAEAAGQETLLASHGVLSVTGLTRLAAAPDGLSAVDARFGLQLALRGIARDRSPTRLHLTDGTVVDGTVDRVGGDFVEVALHPLGEPRRRSVVSQTVLVTTSAIVGLRRHT